MSDIEFHLTDNSKKVLELLGDTVDVALTECGLQATRHAYMLCAVDTGRLRNSITFALGGKPANIKSYHGDKPGKSGKGDTKEPGTYSGTAPKDGANEKSVYIGTNVEYAEKIELGASQKSPKGFLRPAILEHGDEYKQIIQDYLEKAKDPD